MNSENAGARLRDGEAYLPRQKAFNFVTRLRPLHLATSHDLKRQQDRHDRQIRDHEDREIEKQNRHAAHNGSRPVAAIDAPQGDEQVADDSE